MGAARAVIDAVRNRLRIAAAVALVVAVSVAAVLVRTGHQEAVGSVVAAAMVVAVVLRYFSRTPPAPPGVAPARLSSLALPPATLTEVRTLIDLLRSTRRARRLGVEVPAGALLIGPPGCGKTLVARAIATETRRAFIPCSAAELTSPWSHMSTQVVAAVFARARELAPSVVFIDEIDAVAADRAWTGRYGGAAAHDYTESTDELLQNLDGVRGESGVFALAATNFASRLDPALRDRLAYTVSVGLPDQAAREKILRMHWPGRCSADPQQVAVLTEGRSGRDLRELCRVAGLLALADNADQVTAQHFQRALNRRIAREDPDETCR